MDGLVEWFDGLGAMSGAVAGQPELVEHAGIPFVQGDVRLVAFHGAILAAEGDVDVTEEFEGLGCRRVDVDGFLEVPERRFQFALRLVDGAALEVGHHGVGLQRDCPAVRLQGLEMPVFGHGSVAGGDQPLEFAFVGVRAVGEGARHAGHGHEHDYHNRSTHRSGPDPSGMVANRRELSGGRGF